MIGSVLLPISLFWFAWTAQKDVHWITPIIATVPFGCGNLLVYVGYTCAIYYLRFTDASSALLLFTSRTFMVLRMEHQL